jgi:hypothetical protein
VETGEPLAVPQKHSGSAWEEDGLEPPQDGSPRSCCPLPQALAREGGRPTNDSALWDGGAPDEAGPGAECRSGGGRRRGMKRLGARVPCRRDATAAGATAGRAVRQRELWAGLAAARCSAMFGRNRRRRDHVSPHSKPWVCVLLGQVINTCSQT